MDTWSCVNSDFYIAKICNIQAVLELTEKQIILWNEMKKILLS